LKAVKNELFSNNLNLAAKNGNDGSG